MSREEVQQKYIGTRRPSVESYIIEENRLPVGYIQSCQASDSSCAIDIFLDPAMRGRGLGTDAVCTLSEFLTGVEGCRRITADPEAGNIHALSFWQRLGFLPSDHTTEEGNLELTFVPLN
jgi:aminoglycoside 6'-N-acetyltransferase